MEKLNINTFISAASDTELSQYQVLASLKKCINLFHKNKLYPPLGELVELNHVLNTFMNRLKEFDGNLPSTLSGFDFKNRKPIFEKNSMDEKGMDSVIKFIEWALPRIKEGLDEGKAIYDFVDENINIEEIGITPLYKDEGYFLIPDIYNNHIRVFRFELSIIVSSDVPLRSLKTSFLENLQMQFNEKTAESIKLELIKKYPDLPNPAAYNVAINLDFPFDETVLPVAKRKLMRKLAA